MQELQGAWEALRFGGPMVYPLLALGVLAVAIVIDRAAMFFRCVRMPRTLRELIETYGFSWEALESELKALSSRNAFGRFLGVIADNRKRPVWWIESRADDEAGRVERTLGRGLWLLETVVTAAPLLGLLGTITGMMEAFKIIGKTSLVAPAEVTGGVAEALIATALGLLIAVIALFAFNLLTRAQAQTLDEMERLGSKLLDQIRLDHEKAGGRNEAA
jgi:biopolymer transport protein ExbB